MHRAEVSVVIPCYNAAEHLADALDSVLGQTLPPTQVIVIDDGSTDGSADVAARYLPRIEYERQANHGAASARNAGLRRVRGQFVAFLDADDWWHPRKLEHQVAHLTDCTVCSAVYSDWCVCRSPGDAAWRRVLDAPFDALPLPLADRHSGWLYHELLLDSVVHTSAVLFRRDFIESVGLFNEELLRGQDLEYWLRASRVGQVHKLSAVLSAYRDYGSSASKRPTQRNYRALIIERALSQWGMTGPDGTSANPRQVARVLRQCWQDFGYLHLMNGSPAEAQRSVRHAMKYGPWSPALWRLWLRAGARRALSRDE
jgi:glycosyltransferase involved in cell wall biosynthesis